MQTIGLKQYYCHKVYCRTNNNKLKALAEWLKAYEHKVFIFEKEIQKQCFLEVITTFLEDVNSKYRGRDISVRLIEFNDIIEYEFKNGSYEPIGYITLKQIRGTIVFD